MRLCRWESGDVDMGVAGRELLMPIKKYVLLFLLAFMIVGACMGGSYEQGPAQAGQTSGQEKYLLNVTLAQGLDVRNVVYRKERLGGRWLLQVQQQAGLALSARDNKSVSSLSEGEFDELISELLAIIHREHRDQLDSIHVDLALVDPLWAGLIKHIKEVALAPDYIVDPKSNVFLNEAQSYLIESMLVKAVCERVDAIGRKCRKSAVSMNPIVFRSQHLRKRWEEVEYLPDAGIEKESVWFSIDLEKSNED